MAKAGTYLPGICTVFLILFNVYKITQKSWGAVLCHLCKKEQKNLVHPEPWTEAKRGEWGALGQDCLLSISIPILWDESHHLQGSHFLWCKRNTKALHTGPNVWGPSETAQDALFAQHSGKLTGSWTQQWYSRCSLSMLHSKSCLHSSVYKWTIWNAPEAASTGSQVTKYSHLAVYDRHLVVAEPEFWGDQHWSALRRKKGTSESLEW